MNPPGAAWVRRHVTPTHNHAREWSVLGLTPRLVILVGVMWRSGAGRIVAARPRAVPASQHRMVERDRKRPRAWFRACPSACVSRDRELASRTGLGQKVRALSGDWHAPRATGRHAAAGRISLAVLVWRTRWPDLRLERPKRPVRDPTRAEVPGIPRGSGFGHPQRGPLRRPPHAAAAGWCRFVVLRRTRVHAPARPDPRPPAPTGDPRPATLGYSVKRSSFQGSASLLYP